MTNIFLLLLCVLNIYSNKGTQQKSDVQVSGENCPESNGTNRYSTLITGPKIITLRVIFWKTRAANLWDRQNLVIIAYFSLIIGKLITENLWLDIPWWIFPKSLRKWVVSLSSNASINYPPHPALFYQNMTLKVTRHVCFENSNF